MVPSGALTALPFHLLVTEKPAVAVPQVNAPRDLAAYRDAAWLLKRHAVSVLPSVASLKALRVFARKDEAKSPLIGFGDPVFNADEESRPAAEQRSVVATRSYTEFWKGVDIDRSMLSKALPRLPETAAELRAVAQKLGAPASDIQLRRDASETNVKRAALADYRVVYFATHGLVAGEIKGLAEPSLALTLPEGAERPRRRPSHRQRGGAAQAQRRLGGALRLQHHRRRQARRGSTVRTCPRVLLCRRPRAARLALGGGDATRRRGSPPRRSTS